MPYPSFMSNLDPRQILARAYSGRSGQPQDQRLDPYTRALGLSPSQPAPASFRDLPQDYRRQAQGTALAALGAEIGAAPAGRLGEGIARGAYAFGKERSGALDSFTKAAMEAEKQQANIEYQQALQRQMADATRLREQENVMEAQIRAAAAKKAAETERMRVEGLNAIAEMIPAMHPSLQGAAAAAVKGGQIQEAQQIVLKNAEIARKDEEEEREMQPFRNWMENSRQSNIPKQILDLAQVRADSGDPKGATTMLASAVARQQAVTELTPRFEEEAREDGMVRTRAVNKRTGATIWVGEWTDDPEIARFERRLTEKMLGATTPRFDPMGLVEGPDGGVTLGSNLDDVNKAYSPEAIADVARRAKAAVNEAYRKAAPPKTDPATTGGTPEPPKGGGVPADLQEKMLRELEPRASNLFSVAFSGEEDDPIDEEVVSAWLRESGTYGVLMAQPRFKADILPSLVFELRRQRAARGR